MASTKKTTTKNYLITSFALLLAVTFAGLNIGTSLLTSSYKLDLTSSRQYTLNQETLSWLSKNQEPIFIKLYLSPQLESEYPLIGQYARYVVRLLEQYQINSNGKISFEIIETKPYSNAEDEAKKQNIRSFIDTEGKQNLYFGAVFSNYSGQSYTLPYFEIGRKNYVEHDISRILSKMSGYEPKTIGILSSVLPVIDKKSTFENGTDWPFVKALKEDYNVEYIRNDKTQIPVRIKTLIVVNPSNLGEMTVYALDQYLMRGGRILLFMDPFSESFLSLFGYINSASSNLEKFLYNFGISYSDDLLVGDNAQSQSTLMGSLTHNQIKNYPLWMDINKNFINQEHTISKDLRRLQFRSAGSLALRKLPDVKSTILFTTGTDSGEIDSKVAKYASKSSVIGNFINTGKSYNLAVLQEGKFVSMFEEHPLRGTETEKMMIPFLITSIRPGKLLVVSDADMLFSPNWNAKTPKFSNNGFDSVPFNNNYDFIEKAVDYLSESGDLLSISSKETFENKTTFAQILQNHISKKYQKEQQQYTEAIRQAQSKQRQLNNSIKEQAVFPSTSVLKQVESLQRIEIENKSKLQELEFKISEEQKLLSNLFIIFNMIVFPGIIILLLAIFNIVRRRKIYQEAKEYAND